MMTIAMFVFFLFWACSFVVLEVFDKEREWIGLAILCAVVAGLIAMSSYS